MPKIETSSTTQCVLYTANKFHSKAEQMDATIHIYIYNYNVYTCKQLERQHNLESRHLHFHDSSGVLVVLVLELNTISDVI